MKRLALAALVVSAVAAIVLALSPEAFASLRSVQLTSALDIHACAVMLAVGLDAQRAQHAELVRLAAAKIAEVTDGMDAATRFRIEAEHAELVADARTVADAIAAAERSAPPAPAAAAAPPPTPAPAATDPGDAIAAERSRVAEIHRLGLRHASVLPEDFAANHIGQGTSIDAVRSAVLDLVAEDAQRTTINPRVQNIRDEGDTLRARIGDAVALRANPQAINRNTEQDRERIAGAREFRGMSLIEMGREFVEIEHGVRLRGVDKREMAGILLGLQRSGGMMSTSDFPNILANVVVRRLRDAYGSAVQTWRPFCRQNNAPDFRERAVVQLKGMPDFLKVREGAEYQRASLAEAVEKYSIATYGRIIGITRQTIINDDLGAFEKLPVMFGRAAAEFESDTVWGIILSSPNMGDGIALFHADHGNLAGAGGDPSEATVEAGEIAIGAQVDDAGKPMNLKVKFIAVSRKHKNKAQKLLTAIGAAATGDVNVYANSMDLIIEDRLFKAGVGGISPWLLIGDPSQWDTIEYAYLEGDEGLFTEQRVGFEVDGVEVKGRLDFGAKAIDFRPFYKNPGN
jgi:hypothetical protein